MVESKSVKSATHSETYDKISDEAKSYATVRIRSAIDERMAHRSALLRLKS